MNEINWVEHNAYLDCVRIHLPMIEEHTKDLRWKLHMISDDFVPCPGNKIIDIKALKEKWLNSGRHG